MWNWFTDPSVLSAIAAVVLGVVFIPNGVVQQVLTALGRAIEAWAKQRMPATIYAQLSVFAETACKAAWQQGEAYAHSNEQRKQNAMAALTALAHQHGIDIGTWAPLFSSIIEATWADIKPQVLANAAYAALHAPAQVAQPATTASIAVTPEVFVTHDPSQITGQAEAPAVAPAPAAVPATA